MIFLMLVVMGVMDMMGFSGFNLYDLSIRSEKLPGQHDELVVYLQKKETEKNAKK